MKHMLAAKCGDLANLKLPLYVSPKLDGIRASVVDGVLLSRNMKPIPNVHTQRMFGLKKYEGLDGELIVGAPNRAEAFNDTTRGVMKTTGAPNVMFHVFDDFRAPATPFHMRLDNLRARVKKLGSRVIEVVPHVHCGSVALLQQLEEEYLEAGFEGAMLRSPYGEYKFGRSTEREQWLLKLKRFEDSEAVIDGVEELEHNRNEAQRDANGRTKRSSAKAGKVRGGTLGNLLVRDCYSGVAFSIGSGFTAGTRAALWEARETLIGKVVRYRYFPTGSKTRPRFPTFQGFRDAADMSCN